MPPLPHRPRAQVSASAETWPEAAESRDWARHLPGHLGAPVSPQTAREVGGPGEGAPRTVPSGVPHPPRQGDSGFRCPGGVGAGRGAATSEEAHSEGGRESSSEERIWACWAAAGSVGRPAHSMPQTAVAPPRSTARFASFSFLSPFFSLSLPLISCKLLAEALHSLAAAPESVLFKRQAASARAAGDPGETDTPNRTPKGSLLSTTEPQESPPPKVDGLPWDPMLTKEKLLETTAVPGELCIPLASQAPHPSPFPLGGAIASHPPQSPALRRPSLHPLPKVAWGTVLLFSSWPQSLPHPTTPSLQSLISNHLACFTWLVA